MNAVAHHLAWATWTGAALLTLFALAMGARLSGAAAPRRRGPLFQAGLAVVPTAVALALFLVGFRGYVDAAVAPGDALEVSATADGWRWHFVYPSGNSSDDGLRVPVGRPVHVTVHSGAQPLAFVAPALHVATVAAPGADGSAWLVANQAGDSLLLCGLGCSGHPSMPTLVRALDAAGWADFDDDGSKLPPAQYGRRLYQKATCNSCHSLDGSAGTGPSFRGLFGRHELLADGSSVTVDAAYVRESILSPTTKVVRGFQPVMPPFAGQLGDKQIDALIAFLHTVQP
jgi:cytochrome c oxidase subunit 2